MGLTYKREEIVRRMPIIESRISRSKNGRYLIHKTILTHIKPMAYYEAIIANSVKVDEEDISEDLRKFLEEEEGEVVA
ncbi:hypothetical protein JW868_01510 [Candidatus Woesearchaeota archaeon]|nr:hypothetical protein [Candidatus Woesearchaeota archaeon]